MKLRSCFVCILSALQGLVSATPSPRAFLEPSKLSYGAGESLVFKAGVLDPKEEIWDTYLSYTLSSGERKYISLSGNSRQPKVLGMLPSRIVLHPQNWHKNEKMTFTLSLCNGEREKPFATAEATVDAAGDATLDGEPMLAFTRETSREPVSAPLPQTAQKTKCKKSLSKNRDRH